MPDRDLALLNPSGAGRWDDNRNTDTFGGTLAKCVDISIVVPSASTARVQECQIAIGHLLCELVEMDLFGKNGVP